MSQGLPRPWRRWTLRTRLVVAIAVLTGVALLFADAAGLAQLRSNALSRVDDQLKLGGGAYLQPPPPPPGRTPSPSTTTPTPGASTSPPNPNARDSTNPSRPFDSICRFPDQSGSRPRAFRNLSPGLRIFCFYPDGAVDNPVNDQGADGEPALGSFAALTAHLGGRPYTVHDRTGGDPWRVIVRPVPRTNALLVIAVSLRQVYATQNTLLGIDAAVTALALLLLGALAAWVVRLGLAPLTAMENTAQQISAGDLSQRVDDVDPHTEAGRLGIAFNTMLGQIESALAARTASEQRLRQFLADASHELRTPLTSILGFAELYRRGGTPPGEALDEAMGRIEAEAARMAVLVGDLMLLARLDEERPLERRPVDLLAIAADAVRDAHARVPGRFVALDGFDEVFGDLDEDGDLQGEEPMTVYGDEARLRQVATNLLANALQHTPPNAAVTVRVGRNLPDSDTPATVAVGQQPPDGGAIAVLEVTDTGPGMSAEQAERAFERLYRADPSRHRASGGGGLGLAIVAAIVGAHGGRVELRTVPGAGASFRVLLPAQPVASVALSD